MDNTDINSGTDVAPETAPAAPTEEVKQETSATSPDETLPKGEGKVTDADEDKATGADTEEEGGKNATETGFTMDDIKFPDSFTVTDEQKAALKTELDTIGIKDKATAESFLKWVEAKNIEAAEMSAKQQEKEMNDLEARWVEEGKKDPELGKDYDKNVADAMTLVSQVFSPRTVDFLKDTKFNANPDFLKDMLRLAKERADAELVGGKSKDVSNGIQRDGYGNPMLKFKD